MIFKNQNGMIAVALDFLSVPSNNKSSQIIFAFYIPNKFVHHSVQFWAFYSADLIFLTSVSIYFFQIFFGLQQFHFSSVTNFLFLQNVAFFSFQSSRNYGTSIFFHSFHNHTCIKYFN